MPKHPGKKHKPKSNDDKATDLANAMTGQAGKAARLLRNRHKQIEAALYVTQ